MNDRDALLAAVIANPAQDAPRLVYADWLDEHDQHQQAQFIREHIAAVGRASTETRLWMGARAPAMFARPMWRDFDGAFTGLAERVGYRNRSNTNRIVWHRGFVCEVQCSFRDWFFNAKQWRGSQPIERVTVPLSLGITPYLFDSENGYDEYFFSNQWLTSQEFRARIPAMMGQHLAGDPWSTHVLFWRALVNCYPGIEFVVRNAPADIYPTFAPKRDGQFFRSGNRP